MGRLILMATVAFTLVSMSLAADNPCLFEIATENGSLFRAMRRIQGLNLINGLNLASEQRIQLISAIDETVVPSLALETLRVATGTGTILIKSSDSNADAPSTTPHESRPRSSPKQPTVPPPRRPATICSSAESWCCPMPTSTPAG